MTIPEIRCRPSCIHRRHLPYHHHPHHHLSYHHLPYMRFVHPLDVAGVGVGRCEYGYPHLPHCYPHLPVHPPNSTRGDLHGMGQQAMVHGRGRRRGGMRMKIEENQMTTRMMMMMMITRDVVDVIDVVVDDMTVVKMKMTTMLML